MDPKILRTWSVAFGGVAMAGAVSIAALTGKPQAPDPKTEPTIAAPLGSRPIPPEPTSAPEPVAEPASAPEPEAASRPGFLVHFASIHPLGRAHTLAAEGREGEARALVERIMPQRRDLRGLCFDRFTLGGAEIVFVSCAELSGAASETFQRRWASRFQSMAGVDYAEPNSIADVEQRR